MQFRAPSPTRARKSWALAAAAVVFATGLFRATPARADVTHIVQRGHTLEAIAHRYHVTVKAITDANHIRDPRALRVGQQLVIPGVTPPAARPAPPPAPGAHGVAPAPGAHGAAPATHPAAPAAPRTYAARPTTPGVIHGKRLLFNEDFTLRVTDRRGRIAPTTLKTAEHLWRSAGGATHELDPRLLALLGVVSDHFGSRPIEIISGFRPYSPTQYTAHSNHNVGHAVDFRIVGVPNEALRDFCRTLRNVGCGYYPNSVFVHMDTRTTSAYWIDYSKPGEAPRYNAPNTGADEGTSDVGNESHTAAPADGTVGPGGATGTTGTGTTTEPSGTVGGGVGAGEAKPAEPPPVVPAN
jgi:uncharacterized protein YcbK (DUF882 family)